MPGNLNWKKDVIKQTNVTMADSFLGGPAFSIHVIRVSCPDWFCPRAVPADPQPVLV